MEGEGDKMSLPLKPHDCIALKVLICDSLHTQSPCFCINISFKPSTFPPSLPLLRSQCIVAHVDESVHKR